MLLGLDEVFRDARPDIALVHGDTTTAFAGALAAFYRQISVGHVEAGLRTRNRYSPYPEEMNRQMIDRIADMYFAPTLQSKQNLLAENVEEDHIFVTGNTAIDALKTTVARDYAHPILDWAGDCRLILLTAHRRENHGEPLRDIFRAVRRVTEEFSDVKIVYPVHMNPNVREAADEILTGDERIRLIEPMDTIEFHNLMNASYMILTDSGGIQEEAPSLGKPVLVLRNTTERPEGIEAGTLRLVGTRAQDVYAYTKELLTNNALYERMSKTANPYGDGNASSRIADAIERRFVC